MACLLKIWIPVGTMEAVTLIKVHGPGDIGDVVPRAGHIGCHVLSFDVVGAGDGGGAPLTSTDLELFLQDTVFEGICPLGGKNHDDLFAAELRSFRNGNGCGSDEQLLTSLNVVQVG